MSWLHLLARLHVTKFEHSVFKIWQFWFAQFVASNFHGHVSHGVFGTKVAGHKSRYVAYRRERHQLQQLEIDSCFGSMRKEFSKQFEIIVASDDMADGLQKGLPNQSPQLNHKNEMGKKTKSKEVRSQSDKSISNTPPVERQAAISNSRIKLCKVGHGHVSRQKI